jgi:hypothetical protein
LHDLACNPACARGVHPLGKEPAEATASGPGDLQERGVQNTMPAGAVITVIFFCLIPIVAIVANAVKNMKNRDSLHKERLKAIEMGLTDLPQGLLDAKDDYAGLRELMVAREEMKSRRGRGSAMHGVVWAGVGLGLLASTYFTQGDIQDSDLHNFLIFLKIWAFPALFVGLGLIGYAIATRNGKSETTTGPAPTPK